MSTWAAGRRFLRTGYWIALMLTFLIGLVCYQFSQTTGAGTIQGVAKFPFLAPLPRALCQLYHEVKLSATRCCSSVRRNQTVKSLFDCLEDNPTQFPSSQRLKEPSRLYQDWVSNKPPKFQLQAHYHYHSSKKVSYAAGNLTCPFKNSTREACFRLLQFWSSLAKKYNIVWWITFGTLIGAVR